MLISPKTFAKGITHLSVWLFDEDKRLVMNREFFAEAATYSISGKHKVKASLQEVFDVLTDEESCTKWFPAAFAEVKLIDPGEDQSELAGLGKIAGFRLRGWLPNELKIKYRVVESRKNKNLKLELWGDFLGFGSWTLKQDGKFVEVSTDWKVIPNNIFVKSVSLLIKPLLKANYAWSLNKVAESLELEIVRRRAKTESELQKIAKPPSPSNVQPWQVVAGALLLGCGFVKILEKLKKNK
jgi:hypothetical protein